MKLLTPPIPLILILLMPSCEKTAEHEKPGLLTVSEELKAADTPILPVKRGDFWKYKVSIEIPPGITYEGSAAEKVESKKTRRFLGKIEVSEDHPPVDTFEVVVPGEPIQHELVEILDNKLMILGTFSPETLGAKPLWLDPPLPFVVAGVRGGQRLQGMRIVGREDVVVPAGKYSAIRILMTSDGGQIETRRTTWFAPHIGIVKEEMMRYVGAKLIFRETSELQETSVKSQ